MMETLLQLPPVVNMQVTFPICQINFGQEVCVILIVLRMKNWVLQNSYMSI